LAGFDASTSGKGTNNPEPILLRIQTPAVLSNDMKANLSGCFVIARAVGRLDKERTDVRLVSLSCRSNEGKAIKVRSAKIAKLARASLRQARFSALHFTGKNYEMVQVASKQYHFFSLHRYNIFIVNQYRDYCPETHCTFFMRKTCILAIFWIQKCEYLCPYS